MDDDWGLNAVVRGCCSSAATSSATMAQPPPRAATTATVSLAADHQPFGQLTTTATANSFLFSSSTYGHVGQLFSISSPSSSSTDLMSSSTRSFGHGNTVEDLHELYKPFFPKSETNKNVIQTVKSRTSDVIISSAKQSVTTPRSKKRKNQVKKVCQVPQESLSSDIWAWRKYGQKPIKGSPYPRGYYRCSSSKGCLARKQVERNRSDPGMFIVTYTAEHNHPAPTHRNSLAGSTRQKPSLSSDPSKLSELAKPTSPATSPENESPAPAPAMSGSATESKEGPESSTMLMDEDEDDEEFGFDDVAVSDEFFVGLEGLGSPATGEFLSDNFPASFGLPWSVSSAATAAGGR